MHIETETVNRRDDWATRTQLAETRTELKVEMHQVKSDLLRWMFSALMGQTLLIMGIMYFLLQNAR
jgi:hypothetical protein